jgi:hypothetical protein
MSHIVSLNVIILSLTFFISCFGNDNGPSRTLSQSSQQVAELAADITLGPEFEFDHPLGKSSYDNTQAISSLLAVYSALRNRLGGLSNQTSLDGSAEVFRFRSDIVSQTGIGSASLVIDSGFVRAQIADNFHALGTLTYYRLTLVPDEANQLIKNPITISYTKDDVLFEVNISPLNTKQYKKISALFDLLIFETMRSTRLIVPDSGGGHIHMGLDSLAKTMDQNLKKVAVAVYNYLKIMYESDRFVQAFLRPDENYAITPSMASDLGRQVLKNEFDSLLDQIKHIDISEASSSRWFADSMHRVTMYDFFDEITNGDGLDEFRYFGDWESAANNREYFTIYPGDDDVHGAFRYNSFNNTLETRALKSQKSMAEFIAVSEFLTRLLVGSSFVEPTPLILVDEIPSYKTSVTTVHINQQFIDLLNRAHYSLSDNKQLIRRLMGALKPNINCR